MLEKDPNKDDPKSALANAEISFFMASILIFACNLPNADLNVVKLLVEAGANLNTQIPLGFIESKNVSGTNALKCALVRGKPEIAKYLLKKGAKTDEWSENLMKELNIKLDKTPSKTTKKRVHGPGRT